MDECERSQTEFFFEPMTWTVSRGGCGPAIEAVAVVGLLHDAGLQPQPSGSGPADRVLTCRRLPLNALRRDPE